MRQLDSSSSRLHLIVCSCFRCILHVNGGFMRLRICLLIFSLFAVTGCITPSSNLNETLINSCALLEKDYLKFLASAAISSPGGSIVLNNPTINQIPDNSASSLWGRAPLVLDPFHSSATLIRQIFILANERMFPDATYGLATRSASTILPMCFMWRP